MNQKLKLMKSLNILLGIIGTQEIILIALVVLLFFGGKKIPELMRGLGRGVSEFKKGRDDISSEPSSNEKKTSASENNSDLKG